MLSETAKSPRVSNVAPTGWATEGRKFYDWTGMCFRRFGWRKGEEGEGWSGVEGMVCVVCVWGEKNERTEPQEFGGKSLSLTYPCLHAFPWAICYFGGGPGAAASSSSKQQQLRHRRAGI
jgi:hypothetical protein